MTLHFVPDPSLIDDPLKHNVATKGEDHKYLDMPQCTLIALRPTMLWIYMDRDCKANKQLPSQTRLLLPFRLTTHQP